MQEDLDPREARHHEVRHHEVHILRLDMVQAPVLDMKVHQVVTQRDQDITDSEAHQVDT